MKYREIQEYLLEGSITIEKSLEPYKDDPSMYISYTELDKIGINPQSEYLTPNGVYAYPLKEIWEDLIDDKIPFASNAKYVNLIKSDHVCDLGGVGNYPYTESMLERDKKNIEKIYGPYEETIIPERILKVLLKYVKIKTIAYDPKRINLEFIKNNYHSEDFIIYYMNLYSDTIFHNHIYPDLLSILNSIFDKAKKHQI